MSATAGGGESAEPRERRIEWAAFRNLWDRQEDERAAGLRAGTTAIAVAAWLAALFVVFLTWNGAAERTHVAAQVPYLVSGGLTALLLTIVGAAVIVYGALMEAGRGAERLGHERDHDSGPVDLRRIDERRAG